LSVIIQFLGLQHFSHAHVSPVPTSKKVEPTANHQVERLEHPGHRLNCVPVPDHVDRCTHAKKLCEAARVAK